MKSNLLLPASLHFICGVTALSYIPLQENHLWLCAGICTVLIFVGLVLFCREKRAHTAIPFIVFFLCGALCAINHALGCEIHFFPSAGEKLFHGLKSAVNGAVFQKTSTRALVQALLCGDRTLLPRDIQQDFKDSGAAHILALSGLHLAILSGILKKALFFSGHSPGGKIIRNAFLIITAAIYTLACGAGASLVRAFIFITISAIADMCPQRKAEAANRLLFAAMIQLTFHPEALRSLSFQLSYLSCAGIITLKPYLSLWLPEDRGPARKIWESLSLSLSCQILTAPLVYLEFGTVPKYFLLTNLLALPVCEFLIHVSVCTIILNALGVHPKAFIWLGDMSASLMLDILHIISSIP